MNKRKKENERTGVDRHTDRYMRGEWESKVWGAKKTDDKVRCRERAIVGER